MLPLALAILTALGALSSPALARDCSLGSVGLPPLTDLGSASHLGFQGGLYPGGANQPPPAHQTDGLARAAAIQPLGPTGSPDPAGRIVVLMIGMSNGVLEFRRLVEKLEADADIDPSRVVLAMGAQGGQSAEFWEDPGHENFDRIENAVLGDLNVTEAQVQVVLVKSALQSQGSPPVLPAANAQAYDLERALGNGARALASRYPNLQQVFYTSRIYAGYATSDLSPEPYAWETGFSVKWLLEAQIEQRGAGIFDPESGDLGVGVAPWLGWGPYLWADGATPRSDGFFWACEDLREDDGTHPGEGAIEKVADQWRDFLRGSTLTNSWLLGTPPPAAVCGDGSVGGVEECDDGNTRAGDGCDALCRLESSCGDGSVTAPEECDDGNTRAGDGCDALCRLESDCGDGSVGGIEECDDGNTRAGDGCSPICRVESCPDVPRDGCRPSPQAKLRLLEHRPGREKLSLRLAGLDAATSDFGDPALGTTRFGVCLYDSADSLVAELEVDRAGDLCGRKQRDCWDATGERGFRYRDADAASAGVTRIRARSGEGRGRIDVRGANHDRRGRSALPVGTSASLSGHATASAQVVAHDGACFHASLTDVTKDDGMRWKARTQ